jgi:hypothetical protein
MASTFAVRVDIDQFERLARPTQPVPGVAELIWNAVDAEAETVAVILRQNELGAIEDVIVEDTGHGMTHDEVLRDFQHLGGSWKLHQSLSKHGRRTLHGKQGAGRFRAFALGRTAEWTTVAYRPDGELERTVVSGTLDSPEWSISEPETLATGTPGTSVRVFRPRDYTNRLLVDDVPTSLTTKLALYLTKYPDVAVTFNGNLLDPKIITESDTRVDLDAQLGGEHGTPQLRIIEWKDSAGPVSPCLLLCDEAGAALHELTEGLPAHADINYTAYITWRGFSAYVNDLLLAEMGHDVLSPVISAAREEITKYLDSRRNERHATIVEQWKAENVYPFSGSPQTPLEVSKRYIFDAVAVAAAPAVAKEPRAARLSLRLLREALEDSPAALHRVMREVLDLTQEQLADFDELLQRTSLAAVIRASKIVADRLVFLDDLEAMIFDHDKKNRLLERQQLHRILADGRTWLFGEDYSLAVSDGGLTKVLDAHLRLLGRGHENVQVVRDSGGRKRIVDLMLSAADQQQDRRRHLVVELKRPSLTLSDKELTQITKYALAVVGNERFRAEGVRWDFWLVGNETNPYVEELTTKQGEPGVYMAQDNYTIRVRRWANVLEENRRRLHFYKEHLDYHQADDATLEATLSKYLDSPAPNNASSPTQAA